MNIDNLEDVLIRLFERYPECPAPDQEPKKFYYHLMMFLYSEGYFNKNV